MLVQPEKGNVVVITTGFQKTCKNATEVPNYEVQDYNLKISLWINYLLINIYINIVLIATKLSQHLLMK